MTENYKIVSLLGSGGFSNVFLAEHRETGDRVAIKILNNAEGDARFARESAVLQTLQCEHTVRLLDFGRSVSGPFMVFEFVEGAEDLEVFLDRNGAVPWPTAVALLRQMLVSLAEAHEIGVVHRDIKPANMLITPDAQIKVLDFGLVRLLPTLYDVTPLTQTGKVLGTPRYMSPEVLRASESASPGADIFAIGMIAHLLLTGRHANDGRSAYEVIARHMDLEPYVLPHDADVPYAIRAWVDAMLRKDPRRRTPDASAALAELEQRLAETPPPPEQPALTVGGAADTAPTVADVEQRRVARFTLREELGRGATATVWSASHRQSDGEAAVKFLLAGVGDDVREAFWSEARAHAALEHSHIVRLLDYGHVEEHDAPPPETRLGDPYLVMELANGTLREHGLPTTWGETFDILIQVLSGLAYAHARGVIHRDLKPENVLRFTDGTYKVADFGIAHSLRSSVRQSAQTLAESIGTPRYMSPEQFRGRSYDYGPATDLYALGCLAYELVVGRVPFTGPRLVDIARQHESEPMPNPIPRFDVPEGLAGWLARLLAKRPHERFEAAADASWQLRQVAAGFVESEPVRDDDFRGPSDPTFVAANHEVVQLAAGAYLTVLQEDWQVADDAPTDSSAHRVEPSPRDPPPLPASWRRPTETAAEALEGLGLFSLRETPLAGQYPARDALWGALQQATASAALVPVVLHGEHGAPVSRLGHWFAARAAEVGAANPVFLSHTVAGSPREGLAGAIEDLFGTWALDDDDAATLVRQKLVDASASFRELVDADAEILAQEVLRGRGRRPLSASSEHERFSAFGRALRPRTTLRPLVVFVDQIQVSPESTALVRHLLDSENELPAVVVVGRSGPSPHPALQRDLDALAEDERCLVIDVRPYDDAEFAEFATQLLPIDDDLLSELARATDRDPGLARLALADLIDRGLLSQQGDVFGTTRELEPDELSLEALIERRLALLQLDSDGRRALAICASLGEAPDLGEVQAVCRRLGVPLPGGFGPALQKVGLARSAGTRWWFTRGVAQHVIQALSRSDRREILRACGHVVVERTAPDDAESWGRAARYYVDAGAAHDALEPLYRAVRLLVTRDLDHAEALAAHRGALLGSLGATPQSTAWIDQLNLMSLICKTRGDRRAAAQHTTAAHDLAQAEGYSRGLARALRDSAAMAVDLGSLGEAAARFDRAAKISADAGDALDEAHAWFGAGFVEYRRANLDAAEQRYRAAIGRFEEIGAHQAQARTMSYLSAVYVAADRLDEARETATAAQELARNCGAVAIVAETKGDLAEIARFSGDYDAARRLYDENARWQRLAGSRSNRAITRLNLALVDLGAQRYDDALASLDALEDDVRDLGLASRLPLIRVARLAALTGTGAEQADEALRQSSELFAVSEPDRDIAWAYECGIRAAADATSRQQWFRERAAAEYRRLGDDRRAASVERR